MPIVAGTARCSIQLKALARPATPDADIPLGLMHPREVLEGVHKGIVDGGNQSGIPTVAGAFLFDESFAKHYLFCFISHYKGYLLFY